MPVLQKCGEPEDLGGKVSSPENLSFYVELRLKDFSGLITYVLYIPVPLQKVGKNEELVYPLRSKAPGGTNPIKILLAHSRK